MLTYKIVPNNNGTVDIFFAPDAFTPRVLRGVVPSCNMVSDIRERYFDYYNTAEEMPSAKDKNLTKENDL